MERNDNLIKKKIYKYMVTGVMTTVALQLGNVVDAMIVGNLIGSLGNGAITASTPYLYILQAATILLGSGGAVMVAILLGRRDTDSAGRVMGFCMLFSILYPLIFTILTPVVVPAFLGLTGATGELANMISQVTTVYSIGMPILSFAVVMAYIINVDNHPGLATYMHITANVVNLVLDFILVKYTSLGITGAAMSTILGYVVAGSIFIPIYFRSSNRMVKPTLKGFGKCGKLIGSTCKAGFPNLSYLIMTVISVSVINTVVLGNLGDSYFSAYAVANNTQLIVQMFLNGVSSVIASVAGVLYGEKDYFGMRKVLKKVLSTALIISGVIMAVFLIYPRLFAMLYGFDNEALMDELLAGLRIFSISFAFFTLNAISQNYYRTTGHTFLSTFSSTLQLLIIKIPLMILGLYLFGFKGIFTGIVFSELLSFVILNVLRMILQAAGKVPKKGFMAIPENNTGEICNFTITGSDANATNAAKQIIEFCRKENLSEDKVMAMGVATEELVNNISRFGYKKTDDKYIDICLSKADDKYYLRLRDDGIPFDPTSYEAPDHDEDEISGLELIKKLSVKFTYMRVISLNNTIIEIS